MEEKVLSAEEVVVDFDSKKKMTAASHVDKTAEKEELKSELESVYTELGQKFYKECCGQNGKGPREVPRASLFNDQIQRINTIINRIDTIIADELAAKGLKRCPECENEVVLASRFCNMCGYKFPSKDEEKEKVARPASRPRCKACGAYLEEDSSFCPSCGKRQ
jgi:hypothetical protein